VEVKRGGKEEIKYKRSLVELFAGRLMQQGKGEEKNGPKGD